MKKTKKQDEKVEQKSVLRSAMIQPTTSQQEKFVLPSWASILLIVTGAIGLVFGLVRLVRFSWYF